jgi:3-hydroxybutyryl-CoA dehydrogenase
MKAFDANTVIGVLGSGAMGSGIAQVAATYGHKVILFDANENSLNHAKEKLSQTLNLLEQKGKLKSPASGIFSKITFAQSAQEFKNSGLIIEAVVEDLEVKHTVFRELEQIVPIDCILSTNTSSLSITSIASACQRPENVIGIHFFNPAPVMALVEVIPALTTNSEIIAPIKQLIENWGKLPVIAKDTPGFIVNRLARPYYGEAIRIYEEGIADFATIDWAMKEIGGFKMGPFELMDFIGNDVNYKVTETVWTQMFFDPRYKPSLTQKRLFEAKWFGKKSGRGYYNYTGTSVIPESKKDKHLAEKIFERIHAMLVNEATEALYLNIATRDDLDKAMEKGVNYPKGLLKWADETGIDNVLSTLKKLYKNYAEDRYRPSILLKEMVKNGTTFY